jgi:hypothetical protein
LQARMDGGRGRAGGRSFGGCRGCWQRWRRRFRQKLDEDAWDGRRDRRERAKLVFEDEVAVRGRQAWPRRSSHGWTSTCVFAYLLATQAVALSKGRKSGGGAWEENEERLG